MRVWRHTSHTFFIHVWRIGGCIKSTHPIPNSTYIPYRPCHTSTILPYTAYYE
ncbi:hypothetical protein BT96DRAFT_826639 [Gymnopus androsaceus JB14]|uniref:Uncharacterized protein n=1 Tax=Gymnopus androsaceus JB14 TaxID=1447944 RepID=A0A6A4HBX4_9AGAR|nr:hypothetical protein BT96DRAFT_826639 [Gymnopus androsaceus JB14]